MFEELKKKICAENLRLLEEGLVILSEGNVSEITPDRKYFVIKPSGVEYRNLTPDKMVVVDLKGEVIEGDLRPSSDTPTHREIYRRFPKIGGIAHTHSPFGTIFAQMKKPIPCYGTTHADAFLDEIPVTRPLTEDEIFVDYELNTGMAIAEILDPDNGRGILVSGHAPFTFGENSKQAVDHAAILEKVAMMSILGKYDHPIQDALLKYKHFHRKHGKGEHQYYGQN